MFELLFLPVALPRHQWFPWGALFSERYYPAHERWQADNTVCTLNSSLAMLAVSKGAQKERVLRLTLPGACNCAQTLFYSVHNWHVSKPRVVMHSVQTLPWAEGSRKDWLQRLRQSCRLLWSN